jgi:ABC-type transporter Mla MlaB component
VQKAEAMLKVSVKPEGSSETWELEGKLSGEWVKELERCWNERPSSAGVTLHLHLKAVSYIDPAGKQLLTAMHARGVQIDGCGCMIKAVVEEITRASHAN